jgi:hypothetical protein
MQAEVNKSGGITFAGLIQLAFIILKLCKVINWSWWLVLMPLWIELGIAVIYILILLIVITKRK